MTAFTSLLNYAINREHKWIDGPPPISTKESPSPVIRYLSNDIIYPKDLIVGGNPSGPLADFANQLTRTTFSDKQPVEVEMLPERSFAGGGPVIDDQRAPVVLWTNYDEKKIEEIGDGCKARINRLMASWDNEKEDEILDYKDQTVDAAVEFLTDLIQGRASLLYPIALVVDMLPASRNSIDLWWDHEKFDLLINFRPDGSGCYHGDDRQGATIADSQRLPNPRFIGCWMESLL